MSNPETVSGGQLVIIVEPLDLEFGIVLGFDPAVEVNRFTLSNSLGLEQGDKLGRRDGSLNLLSTVLALTFLQLLEFVKRHSFRQLAVKFDVFLALA